MVSQPTTIGQHYRDIDEQHSTGKNPSSRHSPAPWSATVDHTAITGTFQKSLDILRIIIQVSILYEHPLSRSLGQTSTNRCSFTRVFREKNYPGRFAWERFQDGGRPVSRPVIDDNQLIIPQPSAIDLMNDLENSTSFIERRNDYRDLHRWFLESKRITSSQGDQRSYPLGDILLTL